MFHMKSLQILTFELTHENKSCSADTDKGTDSAGSQLWSDILGFEYDLSTTSNMII